MIGFFGGSFDPIHFGHISLCVQLTEEYNLTQILFCPAFCSPFKTMSPPIASPKQRLAMLQLALDYPKFKICTEEMDRKGSSYTIDTIRKLKIPGLRLILSSESAAHLDQWKSMEDLLKLAPPLVGSRSIAISSTDVRDRLKKKLYCGHLIPAKVLEYIHQHSIYR